MVNNAAAALAESIKLSSDKQEEEQLMSSILGWIKWC